MPSGPTSFCAARCARFTPGYTPPPADWAWSPAGPMRARASRRTWPSSRRHRRRRPSTRCSTDGTHPPRRVADGRGRFTTSSTHRPKRARSTTSMSALTISNLSGGVVLALSLACGGVSPQQAPPPPASVLGAWQGDMTFRGPPGPATYEAHILVSDKDGALFVTGFCPDGTGAMAVGGPAAPTPATSCEMTVPGCGRSRVGFEIMGVSAGADGLLRLHANGRAALCAGRFVTLTMLGQRPYVY